MNKKQKVFLIIVALVVIVFLASSTHTIINDPNCFLGGGVWRMFSDGCGDSCYNARATEDNPIMCTMAFKENCDCGPLKC
ncbi:hypothetical protein K8R33_03400 [archaeon]|nr:hypothetical protein [archaeon]